ncbi:MAG: hypothetical protein UV58_C0021G0002 [Candidatus Wolfebacteria bacterium GW2011_GWC1_43_10]|uniref:Uncharacterized protein n=1 Tax=Candidatus Wolfebacteria bacterium GW2011_GWC1_43_10 TaxID=1619011 RepID=A0A0G1C7B4_9BACT|nr:MAG: hypothetical protein UV58_C0021G0002 [Candidatus Wolfebacteria bacterium GW2011_GWC1_43_10]
MFERWVSTKLFFAVAALFILSAGLAIYFFFEVRSLRTNPQQVAEEEVQAIVARVGKLMVLPQDEIPTMATILDPAELVDQPFFASAQKGDKVLLYTNAKKAILYSPSQNKIVDVAPVNLGSAPQAKDSSAGEESK